VAAVAALLPPVADLPPLDVTPPVADLPATLEPTSPPMAALPPVLARVPPTPVALLAVTPPELLAPPVTALVIAVFVAPPAATIALEPPVALVVELAVELVAGAPPLEGLLASPLPPEQFSVPSARLRAIVGGSFEHTVSSAGSNSGVQCAHQLQSVLVSQ
jgi:hypothetical protein